MKHETGDIRQETWDSLRQVMWDKRHDSWDVRRETGDRRYETWDRRQETWDIRRETGDRRCETGDMRKEMRDKSYLIYFNILNKLASITNFFAIFRFIRKFWKKMTIAGKRRWSVKKVKKTTQPSVLVKVKHLWRSEASIKYAHVPSSAFCKN